MVFTGLLRLGTCIVCAEFSEELTTVAPEVLARAAGGDGVGVAAGGGHEGPAVMGEINPLNAQHGNPLMLFLQSLLPWNVVVPGGPPPADGAGADGGFNPADYDFDDSDGDDADGKE